MNSGSSQGQELCHGSKCINTFGSYMCICADGFTGDICKIDINEFKNPSIDGACTNSILVHVFLGLT